MSSKVQMKRMSSWGAKPAVAPSPGWIQHPAPAEPTAQAWASPTALAERNRGATPSPLAATGGLGRFRRGDLIHRLFQLLPDLPAPDRAGAAARILAKERDLTPEQRAAVEHTEVAELPRSAIEATAEVVFATGVELDARLDRAAVFVEEADEAAEMIEVPVADHEGVDLFGVDAQQFDVVEQALRRVAEVEHHGARFARPLRLQKQRKAPFIMQGAAIVGDGGRPLALDARDFSGAIEDIGGAIHENADREPVDGGNLDGRGAHGLHAHEGGGGAGGLQELAAVE